MNFSPASSDKGGNDGIVGRAELKLAEAVRAFHYDFRDKTVLDIGSSTGGFTELALKLGAQQVVAVEKGTNQMKAPLRFDSRIDLHEKTDIFDVQKSDLPSIDAVMADVSFVSLRPVLLQARKLTGREADFLMMLKPQFEAKPGQLNRGVVKNERMRRDIIKDFEAWLSKSNFLIIKKRDNDTTGKVGGNRERFYWLRSTK